MALSMRVPLDSEKARVFNPDRDIIFGLARLVQRAFNNYGEIAGVEHLRSRLVDLGVLYNDHVTIERFEEFVKKLAAFFKLTGSPTGMEQGTLECVELFSEENRPFMLELSYYLMQAMFAELPFWFEHFRLESKLTRHPGTEEIDAAAAAVLGRIGRKA